MNLKINDTFNKAIPADPNRNNGRRQVFEAGFSYVQPKTPTDPKLVHASEEVGALLGLTADDLQSTEFLEVVTGAKVLPDTEPYAMAYAGHQFGNWAGQLGDGRAINLAEIVHNNQRWTMQLKGAGETPYSRSADGLAVLRSSIREHLCSEAMFHLGVPTTRSLSLALTGDAVLRDVLYNGNSAYEQGAVVCRVAPTFVRFGNFQLFSARKDHKTLKILADYTIKHFYPEIEGGTKDGYLSFFKTIAQRSLEMVLHWQRVGFVHGVMNTDNMSILGLTIDYGPYGWLEDYNPDWTPNTTDSGQKRYRFGQQPSVTLWNLFQLANALYPLIEDVPALEAVLDQFKVDYEKGYLAMMRQKLGLATAQAADETLVKELENLLQSTETDMTIFFRNLSNITADMGIAAEGSAFLDSVSAAFYLPEELHEKLVDAWRNWFIAYTDRLKVETASDAARKEAMNAVNPKYVLRNYMAQLAIEAAEKGDYSLVEGFFELLKKPYAEQPASEKWFAKRPDWAREKVGCSMLSCSS